MRLVMTCAVVWGLAAMVVAAAGEPPKDKPVLDLEAGSFRAFLGWKTPVLVGPDGKIEPLVTHITKKDAKPGERKPVPVRESARPAADWAGPGFDDSRWCRVRGSLIEENGLDIYAAGNAAEWNLVCLRGAFRVTDPAQAGELRLVLGYRGGAVVYINGVELARGHLPAGELKPETVAETYPEEAYCRPDGKIYGQTDDKKFADRLKVRARTLPGKDGNGVVVPAGMLRKGLNVLAVEVRAAALSKLAVERTAATPTFNPYNGQPCTWAHADVFEARLSCSSGGGLAGSSWPTAEIALHSCQPLETHVAWDFALPGEGVAPIRLVGARNGTFSGSVVLNSAAAIRGLKAAASDLAQVGGAGKIPASAIRVRRAEPADGPNAGCASAVSRVPEGRHMAFDRLLADFPAEIAPVKFPWNLLDWQKKMQLVDRAVAPVWVTVRVPADAPAGDYRGTLTIEAQPCSAKPGLATQGGAEGGTAAKFVVPIELKVHAWRIPDPKDFSIRNNIYQSPDSVARYYKVPLWSDRHFELMGKSFEVFHQVGSKVCVLSLVAGAPTLNNSESMVRWVRKGGSGSGVQGSGAGNPGTAGTDKPEPGTPNPEPFSYDFSVADKYMDLYEKTCGKPAVLVLNVWASPNEDGLASRAPVPPKSVTVVDPLTGKTEPLAQPAYGTPENEAFWRPVLTELRKRLEKRGWFDAAVVDYPSGYGPGKETVSVFRNIWPDGKWISCMHPYATEFKGKEGSMPVRVCEWVWGCGALYNPDADPTMQAVLGRHVQYSYPRAWKSGPERLEVAIPRPGIGIIGRLRDWTEPATYRMVCEAALQGGVGGLGRLGGDFWPLPMGKDGRYVPLCDGYAAVGPLNSVAAMTSPGPEGAEFNGRLEMFREGVQAAEAIICLQRAAGSGKVGGDLAARIGDHLDERARYYLRARSNNSFYGAAHWLALGDWQERDGRLFALCAEVAGGGK